jgi:diaminohydroxyphosphoribosylaminopyrimidine deaminase/5-amino-6-(5-phosphoribosylamino)uracil reductase
VRVVLDTNLRTPPGAKLVKTARRVPTLIVTSKRQNVETSKSQKVKKSKSQNVETLLRRRRRVLERAGCEVCEVDRERHGLNLVRLLDFLHGRGATNVLVEGGGEVLGSFVRAGLADEARVFVAPRLIGGHEAPGPLGQDGPAMMGDITGTRVARIFTLGPDLCYNLRFRREG